MPEEIVLYDLDSKAAGRAWSPNVWKTRYSLNFKGLPYRTVWLECPDIHETLKSVGAPPTEQRLDGSWKYTVPAIHDLNTGKVVAGSIEIAEYLDDQYPNSPRLFPEGTKALQWAYLAAYRTALPAMFPFSYPPTIENLHPRSAEWYITKLGGKDNIPGHKTDEERQMGWKRLEEDFGIVDGWLTKNGQDSPLILEERPSFGDFVFASYILWMRILWGKDSVEWKKVSGWHGRRWSKLLDELEKYEVVR